MRRVDMRGASLRGANMIGTDLYEADLREGTIAEKDKYGNLRVLQHDVGPTELPAAMMNSANLGARQDDRRRRGAGRLHRCGDERLPADPRQPAPGAPDRRQS